MKAAVLHKYIPDLNRKELVVYQEVDPPSDPGYGEVIVKIKAAGVCRTDLHIISGRDLGIPTAPLPHVLGHENAGEVFQVGEGVLDFKAGDKVLCYPFLSSGLSLQERYGVDSQAVQRVTPGINAPGGFSEMASFTERSLIKIDPEVSLESLAPLGDAGLTAYGVIRKLSGFIRPHDVIVVIGIGGVGHIGAQLLNRLTPGKVLAIDPRREARQLAEKLGIKNCYESIDGLEHIFDLSEGQGARAVVDFVGETETASAAITYLDNQGKYVAVGTGGEVRISTAELVAREISIMGSFVGTYTDLVEITELAIRGDIVSQVTAYPMSEVNRALHDLAQGHVIGRAVLVPD